LRGYSDDELKIKLFDQCLTNTALAWAKSISAWEKLKGEFVSRFYPKVK
jgi:hypothetical protein